MKLLKKIIVDREYEIVEEQHIYRGLHSIVYRVKTEMGYYILKELFPNEIHNISKCPRNEFNCPCVKDQSVVIDTCAFIKECEREIEACRIAYVDETEKSNSNYFFKSELLSKASDNDTFAQYILVDTSSGINLSNYAKEILLSYDSEKYLSCIAELMSSACSALARMHKVNRIHLDLKPANMYVCKVDHPYIRIIDLGSSFDLKSTNYDNRNFAYSTTEGYQSKRIKRLARLNNENVDLFKTDLSKLSFKDDIYAMAETLFELLFGTTFSFDPDFGYPGYCECEESNRSYGIVYEKLVLKICNKAAYEEYNKIEEMKADIDSLIHIIKREGYDSSIVKNKSIEYGEILASKTSIIDELIPKIDNTDKIFSDFICESVNDKSNKGVQLIAEGGAGKSYTLIRTSLDLQNHEQLIPLYIPLNQAKTATGYSIFKFIENIFLERTHNDSSIEKNIIKMIEQKGEKSPYIFIFLLDGLNEIVVDESQSGVLTIYDEISKLLNTSNSYIIIASRYQLNRYIFSSLTIKKLLPLSEEEIHYALKRHNITLHNSNLSSIISLPFYLKLFLTITKDSTNSLDIAKPVDLIQQYFLFQLTKLNQANDTAQRAKYEYIFKYVFPQIAKYISKKSFTLNYRELTDCIKSTNDDLSYNNIEELISYIVKSGIIISFGTDENRLYQFVHENYKDYFLAKYWINNKTNLKELNVTLSKDCITFIGDLLEEYKFENKKTLSGDESPCEILLHSISRGIKDDTNIQEFNSIVVEIMKASRNNCVTADYSFLDLSYCDFTGVKCPNSNFSNSIALRSNFYPDFRLTNSDSSSNLSYKDRSVICKSFLIEKRYENIICYDLILGKKVGKDIKVPYHSSFTISDDNIIYVYDQFKITAYDYKTGEELYSKEEISNYKYESKLTRTIGKVYNHFKHLKNKDSYFEVNQFHFNTKTLHYDTISKMVVIYSEEYSYIEFYDKSLKKIGDFLTSNDFSPVCYNNGILASYNRENKLIKFSKIEEHCKTFIERDIISINLDEEFQIIKFSEDNKIAVIVLNKEIFAINLIDLTIKKIKLKFEMKSIVFHYDNIALNNNYIAFIYEYKANERSRRCWHVSFFDTSSYQEKVFYFPDESEYADLNNAHHLAFYENDLILSSDRKIYFLNAERNIKQEINKATAICTLTPLDFYYSDGDVELCLKNELSDLNVSVFKKFIYNNKLNKLYSKQLGVTAIEITKGNQEITCIYGYMFNNSRIIYMNLKERIVVLYHTSSDYAAIVLFDAVTDNDFRIKRIVRFHSTVLNFQYLYTDSLSQTKHLNTSINLFDNLNLDQLDAMRSEQQIGEVLGGLSTIKSLDHKLIIGIKYLPEKAWTNPDLESEYEEKFFMIDLESEMTSIIYSHKIIGTIENTGLTEISDKYLFTIFDKPNRKNLIHIDDTKPMYNWCLSIMSLDNSNTVEFELPELNNPSSVFYNEQNNQLYIFSSIYNELDVYKLLDDEVQIKFIKKIHVLTDADFSNCNFSYIEIKDDDDGKVLQTLLDNGGVSESN